MWTRVTHHSSCRGCGQPNCVCVRKGMVKGNTAVMHADDMPCKQRIDPEEIIDYVCMSAGIANRMPELDRMSTTHVFLIIIIECWSYQTADAYSITWMHCQARKSNAWHQQQLSALTVLTTAECSQ